MAERVRKLTEANKEEIRAIVRQELDLSTVARPRDARRQPRDTATYGVNPGEISVIGSAEGL